MSLWPLSTSILAEYITFRTALLLYWAKILRLGAILFGAWAYVVRARLVKADAPPDISALIRRRILITQLLDACGAALYVFGTP